MRKQKVFDGLVMNGVVLGSLSLLVFLLNADVITVILALVFLGNIGFLLVYYRRHKRYIFFDSGKLWPYVVSLVVVVPMCAFLNRWLILLMLPLGFVMKKGGQWRYLVYVVPVLVLVYLAYTLWMPLGFDRVYSYDFQTSSDAIIIKGWTGPESKTNYRLLNGTANITFEPEVMNGKTDLSLNFTGAPVYIRDDGSWRLFWNPIWNDYELLGTYNIDMENAHWFAEHIPHALIGEQVAVYTRPGLELAGSFLEIMDLEKTYYFRNAAFVNSVNADVDYAPDYTIIDAVVRGSQSYYAYLGDGLDVAFVKDDKNNYKGEDAYELSIYDMDDRLVFQKVIDDDDSGKNSSADIPQDIRVKADLSDGLYRIELNFIMGNNTYPDSYLTDVRFNTNKVVLADRIRLVDPYRLYSGIEQQISMQYGHDTKQVVTFIGNTNFKLDMNEKRLYEVTVNPGTTMDIARGDMIVYAEFLSSSQESFFYPFRYELSLEPDILVDFMEDFGTEYEIKSERALIKDITVRYKG